MLSNKGAHQTVPCCTQWHSHHSPKPSSVSAKHPTSSTLSIPLSRPWWCRAVPSFSTVPPACTNQSCQLLHLPITVSNVTVMGSMPGPFASTALPAHRQGMDVGASARFRLLLAQHRLCRMCTQSACGRASTVMRDVQWALRQQCMSGPQLRMLHRYCRLTKQIELDLQDRHDTTCAKTKKA